MPEDNNNNTDPFDIWKGDPSKAPTPPPEKYQSIVGKLWEVVSGFFEAGFQKVWSGFIDVFWKIVNSVTTWLTETWANFGDTTIGHVFANFRKAGWIDEDTEQDLLKTKNYPFPLNMVFGLGSGLIIHSYYLKETIVAKEIFIPK